MASGVILAGLGLATIGFGARFIIKQMPAMGQKLTEASKALPKMDSKAFANSKYYKGGFDPKMNKREASLILGVSPTASQQKIRANYKKLMLLNHPDRGGSPYISAKISEAKDLLDKN